MEARVGRAAWGGAQTGPGAKCWVPLTVPALLSQTVLLLEMRTWAFREVGHLPKYPQQKCQPGFSPKTV